MVSIFPTKYDVVYEVEESEDDYNPEDMEKYKSMCFYVTDYDCGDQQKAIFEKPNGSMKGHLNQLFIQAKVDSVGVNKMLRDNSVVVNLMHQSLVKNVGKFGTDLKTHNIVLSNYEGKSGSFSLYFPSESHCGIYYQTDIVHDGTIKTNFNLLLGREWIHGVGDVFSSMHHRVVIWRDEGSVENVEEDQSYFLVEVNHVTRKTFQKSLA